MTLVEHLEKLRSLKRRLAIWEAIHHLMDDKFISKDGSSKVGGIRESETGDIVSEDEIEDVLKTIVDGPIVDIKAEIKLIENAEIVVGRKVTA